MRPPVNGTETYLSAIHDRLGEILDRLPAPKPAPEDGTVELREPATAGEQLTEPSRTRKRPAKKSGGA